MPICAPVSFSVYLAWQQGYDATMAHVAAIAESVLRRTDATTDQVFAIYDEFAATMASPPCSEENLQLMQKLDLGSEYVQAVGYIENDTLLCSSHGRHAIRVGPPNYTTAYGTEGRTGVEFPVLRGRRFLLVNHKATGYAVAGALILTMLVHGRAGLRLRWRRLKPDPKMIRRILRIGVPGGVDMTAIVLCHLWFLSIVNSLGVLAAAAHGLAIRIESLGYLPGTAFQVAAATLAGQYLGAGDYRRASRSVLTACLAGGGLMRPLFRLARSR